MARNVVDRSVEVAGTSVRSAALLTVPVRPGEPAHVVALVPIVSAAERSRADAEPDTEQHDGRTRGGKCRRPTLTRVDPRLADRRDEGVGVRWCGRLSGCGDVLDRSLRRGL